MLERTPAEDNLYDDTGRVNDADAAEEMAEREQYYHDVDVGRLVGLSKRELASRQADLEVVGKSVLAEKRREREAARKWEADHQTESSLQEGFIARNLVKEGVSDEAWGALPVAEQQRLKEQWRRREEQSPEWGLEQRLKVLVGRQVVSFEVGNVGNVTVHFSDGIDLSFQSWDARNDAADYDAVEIKGSNP